MPSRSEEILAVCRTADKYCSESKLPDWVSSERRAWVLIKSSRGVWTIRHNRRLVLLFDGTNIDTGWHEFDILNDDWQLDLLTKLKELQSDN